jgi:SAM-dependent methyltransferase
MSLSVQRIYNLDSGASMTNAPTDAAAAKAFYDKSFAENMYAQNHTNGLPALEAFVNDFKLRDSAKVMELGCGRGAFQDLVHDYTGVDVTDSVKPYIRKTLVQASADGLPFADNTFDTGWSIYVLEHVPDVHNALVQIRRVMKSGALLFLMPAWQCRPWAAQGYEVRPYSDFDFGGKLYKASVPIRKSVLWRSMYIFPRRAWRSLSAGRPSHFSCQRLEPNYEKYWVADADAVHSMDPFEMMLWFTSRGDEIVNYPTFTNRFFMRSGPIIVRIRK